METNWTEFLRGLVANFGLQLKDISILTIAQIGILTGKDKQTVSPEVFTERMRKRHEHKTS